MSRYLPCALQLCPPSVNTIGVLLFYVHLTHRRLFLQLTIPSIFSPVRTKLDRGAVGVRPYCQAFRSSSRASSPIFNPVVRTLARPDPRERVGYVVGRLFMLVLSSLQTSAVLPIIVWSFAARHCLTSFLSLFPNQSPRCMFVSPSATENVISIIMCKARYLVSEASGKKGLVVPVKIQSSKK